MNEGEHEAPHELGVTSLRRVRRRLARWCAGLALVSAVGPVAISMLFGILGSLGIEGEAFVDLALSLWLVGWLGGVPLFAIAGLVAAYSKRLGPRALRRLARAIEGSGVPTPLSDVTLRGPEGALSLPPGAVEGALLVAGDKPGVELVLGTGDVLLVGLSEPETQAELLSVLGFGPARRRTVVPLGEGDAPLGAGCAGLFLGMLSMVMVTCGVAAVATTVSFVDALAPYLIGSAFVFGTLLATRLLTPGSVVVGVDGVLVDKPLWRRRFVPRASVVDIRVEKGALRLWYREGETTQQVELTHDRGPWTAALQARLLEVVRSAAPEDGGPEEELARRGRPLAEWREALRRSLLQSGYRGRALSVDTLLAVAEDPRQSAEQRIGAALALGQSPDVDARGRVRLAAESLADERLRRALWAAAEGGEDAEALEEALAVEEAAVAARRSEGRVRE